MYTPKKYFGYDLMSGAISNCFFINLKKTTLIICLVKKKGLGEGVKIYSRLANP